MSEQQDSLDELFRDYLLRALQDAGVTTTRKIIVTAGPWRSYDVQANFSEDGVVKVDFYSVIRLDGRLDIALKWAVESIRLDKPAD